LLRAVGEEAGGREPLPHLTPPDSERGPNGEVVGFGPNGGESRLTSGSGPSPLLLGSARPHAWCVGLGSAPFGDISFDARFRFFLVCFRMNSLLFHNHSFA
jgi:hypothetical protein